MSVPQNCGFTPAVLSAHVKSVRARSRQSRFVGVRLAGNWTGPSRITAGEEEAQVIVCPSVLAVREALSSPPEGEGPIVLLTDRTEQEIGADALSRLAKRRLWSIELWDVVLDLFGAHELDPRLRGKTWLPGPLIEVAKENAPLAVRSRVLDEERAMSTLLRARLGMRESRMDESALLRWTTSADQVAQFKAAPPEMRAGVAQWVIESAGKVGEAVFWLIDQDRGTQALPLGLALRALVGTTSGPSGPETPTAQAAMIRLEAWLGGHSLSLEVARRWAYIAEHCLEGLEGSSDVAAAHAHLAEAQAILVSLKAAEEAHSSRFLPSGFDLQLRQFAAAAATWWSNSGAAETLGTVLAWSDRARDYRRASHESARLSAVDMAERLLRRRTENRPRATPSDLVTAMRHYAAEGAFLDRARPVLAAHGNDPLLGPLIRTLLESVDQEREEENRRFAQILAQSGVNELPAGVLGVESLIAEVVAPLALETRVLLLVLDGLSAAVFRELAESLAHHQWLEIRPTGERERRSVLAALPTLTRSSRTSLFAGRLQLGSADTEKAAFENHPLWTRAPRANQRPVLLHKAEVAKPIRLEQRVVGIVINTVDDHLAKGDQMHLAWTVESIGPLARILREAREEKYTVVLTGDHGHVLERGSVLRSHTTENARARPDDGTLNPGEVRLSGARVLSSAGNTVVAAWSDRVRYGAKQHGYHGGASPAEAVIPLGIFVASDTPPSGYEFAPRDIPAWWDLGSAVIVPLRPVESKPTATGSLFPEVTEPEFYERLAKSQIFRDQEKMAKRAAPPKQELQRLLAAVLDAGGSLTFDALARALRLQIPRLRALLAASQRVLNLDGTTVLEFDLPSNTVRLDRELLERQFDL